MMPASENPLPDAINWVAQVSDAEAGFLNKRPGLRDLLATLDLGISMARDPDGTIRHWSNGCERLYGWTAEEAIGNIAQELLRTIFPLPLADINKALERNGEWAGDLQHFTKDGRPIIVTVHKVLRRDAAGTSLAVMESIADVTAQRLAEKKLVETNAQLAQASKMEALGRLAGGIAHDFNNILQVLQTTIELASQETPDNRRKLLSLAENVGQRGAAITARLLAFARQSELKCTPVAPLALLNRMVDFLAPAVGPAIKLRLDAFNEVPQILTDSGQLETILVNLVNNARDAMPSGGNIVLRATPEQVPGSAAAPPHLEPGAYVRFSVADDGQGISPNILKRVTEPFFTTKPLGKGTGLGLSMAHGFAEQSKGALSIETAIGQGTEVSIWLPQLPAGKAGSAAPKSLILLVEDEAELRLLLRTALCQQGYDVIEAGDAEAALTILQQGTVPRAMITDVLMPGSRSGLDLIALARRPPPRPAHPHHHRLFGRRRTRSPSIVPQRFSHHLPAKTLLHHRPSPQPRRRHHPPLSTALQAQSVQNNKRNPFRFLSTSTAENRSVRNPSRAKTTSRTRSRSICVSYPTVLRQPSKSQHLLF